MTNQTAGRRRWPLYLAGGAVLAAVVAGATTAGIVVARGDNSAASASSPSPSASASPAAPSDPHGLEACHLVKDAADKEQLMNAAVIAMILDEGRQSADFGVRFEAQMLSDRFAIADGGGATAQIELQTQAIKMQTACVKAGLAR